MPTELGKTIRKRRTDLGVGLRELARRIDRSPAYVVALERADVAPGATEETLQALSSALKMDLDVLLALAGKTPSSATPANPIDLALYRLIRALPEDRKVELKRDLEKEVEGER